MSKFETLAEMDMRHEREWRELRWHNTKPFLILFLFLLALLIGGALGAMAVIR